MKITQTCTDSTVISNADRTEKASSAATQSLLKAADINRFLVLDKTPSHYTSANVKENSLPLSAADPEAFKDENIQKSAEDLEKANFSDTGFDISEIALELLKLYHEQKESAEKVQKSEEENVVKSIKAQARDMRSAAWVSFAAGMVESAADFASAAITVIGSTKVLTKEMEEVIAEATMKLTEGIVKSVEGTAKGLSSAGELGAKYFEAEEKDDDAEEKTHEAAAEEAKSQFNDLKEAIQQTMEIMKETAKAQQETTKEISRRV